MTRTIKRFFYGAAALLGILGISATQAAVVKVAGERAGHWDASIFLNYVAGEDLDFDGVADSETKNNYGWGFGPADDYDRRDDGIERSSATGGMSWGSGRNRYRNNRSFFSFGSRRGYYGPPPGYYQDWRGYPPAGHPYWQQPQQQHPAPDAQ